MGEVRQWGLGATWSGLEPSLERGRAGSQKVPEGNLTLQKLSSLKGCKQGPHGHMFQQGTPCGVRLTHVGAALVQVGGDRGQTWGRCRARMVLR